MKKVYGRLIFIFAFFFLFVVTPLAYSQENFRSGETSTLNRGEVVDQDYFGTGEKVTVSGTVNGDVYAAGGNILIDGEVNGDVLAAGGNINITGKVAGNIRAVGGNINIAGEVGRNVSVAGGNINIESGAKVTGSMVAGGGNIQVFGPIGRGMTVGAGSLTIGNTIGSNVLAGVGQIDLTSGAKVNGNLTYYSENKVGLAQESTVSGRITQQFPPRMETPDKEVAQEAFDAGWNVFSFLSTLLIGLFFVFVAPNYTQRIASNVTTKPWLSLGVGFLTLIVFPVFLFALFITIIGIPFAILLFIYYILLLLFVKFFAAIALGEKALAYAGNKKPSLALKLIIGLVILGILGIIPVIGGVVSFVAMLMGLGADVLTKKEMFPELRSKRVL